MEIRIGRIVSGLVFIILAIVLLPLQEMMELFVLICLIPLLFLVACGVVSVDSYNLIRDNLSIKEWRRRQNQNHNPPSNETVN